MALSDVTQSSVQDLQSSCVMVEVCVITLKAVMKVLDSGEYVLVGRISSIVNS